MTHAAGTSLTEQRTWGRALLLLALTLLTLSLPCRPAAGAPARATTTPTGSHRLEVGDELEITIVALPEQSRVVTVRDDGGIYLPLFGNVQVAGLTVDELTSLLERRLSDTLRTPTVLLGLKKTAMRTMVVLGEVVKPGPVNLPAGATLVEALALAGGPTPVAALSESVLVRARSAHAVDLTPPSPGQRVEVMPARDGDVLYVRAAGRVQVAGDVLTPGTVLLKRGVLTAWETIVAAGGAKASAALTRVQLVRAGDVRPQEIDLSQGTASADAGVLVKDGDTLTVPARRVLIVGAAGKGGLVPLTGGEQLLDLLTAAGFSDPKLLKHITVLRAQDVRSGVRQVENVDLQGYIKTGVPPKNLRPPADGDIIVVNPPANTDIWTILNPLLILRGLLRW